jgi:hypothetical protein
MQSFDDVINQILNDFEWRDGERKINQNEVISAIKAELATRLPEKQREAQIKAGTWLNQPDEVRWKVLGHDACLDAIQAQLTKEN